MKSYTDIEESKNLVEMGVDVSTSDMYWRRDPFVEECLPRVTGFAGNVADDVPAWSLGALCEIIPGEFGLYKCGNIWYITYYDNQGLGIYNEKAFSALSGVYELICWCHREGLL